MHHPHNAPCTRNHAVIPQSDCCLTLGCLFCSSTSSRVTSQPQQNWPTRVGQNDSPLWGGGGGGERLGCSCMVVAICRYFINPESTVEPPVRPPWEDYSVTDHHDERLPNNRSLWWKTTQWLTIPMKLERPPSESTLMKDYPMRNHPDERLLHEWPPEWKTTQWETTLMKEFRLLSERLSSETTLMKDYQWDHPDERLLSEKLSSERPPWWDYQWDHPDERLLSERLSSETTLMKDYQWDHPDEILPSERPPWWKTTEWEILPSERPPWWKTTQWLP